MPIVLAGAGVSIAAIIAFIVLYGLLSNVSAWLRPLVDALTVSNRGLLLKVVFFPIYLTGRILVGVTNWVVSWLSQAAAQKLKPMVTWLQSLDFLTDKLLLNIEGLATDTYGALHRLTTRWIPAKIDAAITPVERVANQALVRAGNALDYARTQTNLLRVDVADLTRYVERTVWPYAVRLQARVENVIEPRLDEAWKAATAFLPAAIAVLRGRVDQVEADVNALGRGLAQIGGSVTAEISDQVGGVASALADLVATGAAATAAEIADLSAQLTAIAAAVPGEIASEVDSLRRELEDLLASGAAASAAEIQAIRDRLGELAGSIPAVAAIGVAAVAAIQSFAPDLFCRNTRSVSQKLCGLDPDLLGGLLGGAAALTLLIDAREVVGLGQALAEESAGIVRDLAGIV